jgi:excinuclease ABC subunit A
MKQKYITVCGAREHNLKNIDVTIPREKLVVITGISGSGKSSLAFDTLYAEGNHRYVESLTSYARQFLEQWAKPDADSIDGLPPTISIRQRWHTANPRSTVATTTDLYDFLRLLFARIGKPHCPSCGSPVRRHSSQEIIEEALALGEGLRLMILAPLVRDERGDHMPVLRRVKREGFIRVRINGEVVEARDITSLPRNKKHTIEAVVDRVSVREAIRPRIGDSIELALNLGEGNVVLSVQSDGEWRDLHLSEHFACQKCRITFEELNPRNFSFNSPYGACPVCSGLGTTIKLDKDLIIPDKGLSILNGAISPWRQPGKRLSDFFRRNMEALAGKMSFSLDVPFGELPRVVRDSILHGTQDKAKGDAAFEGVIPILDRKFHSTSSEDVKRKIHLLMTELPCPGCKGARLRPEVLSVTVASKNIDEITRLSISEADEFFRGLELEGEEAEVAKRVLDEIRGRLSFLRGVGLGYITLNRPSHTLSGGESQRIHLATQIGSGLVGVAYILDEPTIGLHQQDTRLLLDSLIKLRNQGNSIIIVEHDEETIRAAEHIIDMGPGAGLQGGEVVAQGTIKDIVKGKRSLTGAYLDRTLEIPLPHWRRQINRNNVITVRGARENNLDNITVDFPLGVFVCVTGVSGSGKSTLVDQILFRALKRHLCRTGGKPGAYGELTGSGKIERAVKISQAPIGKTPRSNPATYSGLLGEIRNLFAMTKEAKIRGYKANRFSFNVRGGRCETCQGQGTKRIEMHFLPDVFVTCESCKGTRYNRETLEIRYRGRNIADVLDMRVEEAICFFKNFPRIIETLKTLRAVGLGYLQLGQSSMTLSGGEAQRIKLSSELARPGGGKTLYLMDEPTTGLHFADISQFLDVLHQLLDKGNSLIVIEHNLDVIKTADWVIDLGPEGGDAGGKVVATGTPEDIAACKESHTGRYLNNVLAKSAVP